jgi:hypothetical protein
MITNVATGGRGAAVLNLGTPFYPFNPAVVGMIGDRILPLAPMGEKEGKFPAMTRESMTRVPTNSARRADGSDFPRGGYDIDYLSYDCFGYGYEVVVPEGMRKYHRYEFDADLVAQQRIEFVLKTEHEARVAAKIFNVGASYWYSSDATLYTDASTDWDSASATIIADVEGAKQQVQANCGMPANTLVVSWRHLKSFKLNTDIINHFPGIDTITDPMLMNMLPALFGVQNVLIGYGMRNTSEQGATASYSDIWEDTYCWVGVVPDGSQLLAPGVGRTIQWDAFGGEGFAWDFYSEKNKRSDVWQAMHFTDEKVFDVSFGHIIKIDT